MSHNSDSPISNASPVSHYKEDEFLNQIVANAKINKDDVYFRFKIAQKIVTEKPQYKLRLDKYHYVYFSVLNEWMYIYVPDTANSRDSIKIPYNYITHRSVPEDYEYYLGNHLSIKYGEICKGIVFHYTEYTEIGNTITKSQEICNFTFEGFKEDNIECIICNKEHTSTGLFIKNNHDSDYPKLEHIRMIIYNIVMMLRNKKQRAKNQDKVENRKEQAAVRKERIAEEASRVAERLATKKAVAKPTKAKAKIPKKEDMDIENILKLLELTNTTSASVNTNTKGTLQDKTKASTKGKKILGVNNNN